MRRVGTSTDDVRRRNLSTVLRLVHHHRALSRSELTRRTGLSRSTTKDLVEELVARRLVDESAPTAVSQAGRPSPIVSPGHRVLAVAVTPEVDAITIGVVGLGGSVRDVLRCPTGAIPTVEDAVAIAARAIDGIRAELDHDQTIVGVGAAVPGLVHGPGSAVQLSANLDWHEAEIGQMLSAATGLPAFAANDANVGAIAEHLFGQHGNADHLIYVNGGPSGIGAGFVVAGGLLEGVAGYAGELGHTYVGGNLTCHCGNVGCLETEVAQAPLARLLGALDGTGAAAVPSSAELEVIRRQAHSLATALGNAVNMLNPGLVVLGGFLRVFPVFAAEDLRDELARRSLRAPRELVRVVAATLGAETLMIGAAELVFSPVLADPGRY